MVGDDDKVEQKPTKNQPKSSKDAVRALAENRDEMFENKAMYSEIMIPNEFIAEFERENEIPPG